MEYTFLLNLPQNRDTEVDMPTLIWRGNMVIADCIGREGLDGGKIAAEGEEDDQYVWISFSNSRALRSPGPGNGSVTEAYVLPVNLTATAVMNPLSRESGNVVTAS